jgi:vanillate O-demethylase monooxygenase subunit
MYIRDAWYAAAWATEVGEELLGRRILDEPVVLFRDEHGEAAAMDNRCPHRFAPLSQGRKAGSVIECRYHGLKFDRSGVCVGGLGGQVPAGRVRTYPVVERHGFIWIWTGAAEQADPALVPDMAFMLGNPEGPFTRYIRLECDYRLATDNLMDLSHAAVLHDETLGLLTPNLANGTLTVTREGDCVTASTAMPNTKMAPDAPPIDQWITMYWQPPGALSIQLCSGTPGSEKPPFSGNACHVLTPETARSTHYFTGTPNRFRHPDDFPRDPFTDEDAPMLKAIQELMGDHDLFDLNPMILPSDAAGVGVRRVIEQIVKRQEQARTSAAA